MTLTPRNGAARPGRASKVWSGSAAVSGSLLSKWNKSCQLSKSVRCPPQAPAYQAHLSLSCRCLFISMCIFLSLSPEGGILGRAANANYIQRNKALACAGCPRRRTTLFIYSQKSQRKLLIIVQNAQIIQKNKNFCRCCTNSKEKNQGWASF